VTGGETPGVVEVIAQAATGALAGLAGYASGDPTGSVAGATGPVLNSAVELALGRLRTMRAGNMQQLADEAAERAGLTVPELLEQLVADERRAQLLAGALEASARTALRGKVLALARVLANAVRERDVAVVDREALILRALADTEAPHVQVLHEMSLLRAIAGNVIGRTFGPTRPLSQPGLEHLLPTHADVLDPLLGTLAAHRAVVFKGLDRVGALRPGSVSPMSKQGWYVSKFGRLLLDYLDAAVDELGLEQPSSDVSDPT